VCCSNVSSDGEYARHKLRECNGLVDAVVAVVPASLLVVVVVVVIVVVVCVL